MKAIKIFRYTRSYQVNKCISTIKQSYFFKNRIFIDQTLVQ